MSAQKEMRKAARFADNLVRKLRQIHTSGGGLAGATEQILLRELLERELDTAREQRLRLFRIAGLLEEDA